MLLSWLCIILCSFCRELTWKRGGVLNVYSTVSYGCLMVIHPSTAMCMHDCESACERTKLERK